MTEGATDTPASVGRQLRDVRGTWEHESWACHRWVMSKWTPHAEYPRASILKAMNQAVTRLYVQEDDVDGGNDSQAA